MGSWAGLRRKVWKGVKLQQNRSIIPGGRGGPEFLPQETLIRLLPAHWTAWLGSQMHSAPGASAEPRPCLSLGVPRPTLEAQTLWLVSPPVQQPSPWAQNGPL